MEISIDVPQKQNIKMPYDPPWYISKGIKTV
jgi:hypothetical protein